MCEQNKKGRRKKRKTVSHWEEKEKTRFKSDTFRFFFFVFRKKFRWTQQKKKCVSSVFEVYAERKYGVLSVCDYGKQSDIIELYLIKTVRNKQKRQATKTPNQPTTTQSKWKSIRILVPLVLSVSRSHSVSINCYPLLCNKFSVCGTFFFLCCGCFFFFCIAFFPQRNDQLQ